MAFDEQLAARARRALGKRSGLIEKKMFGGIAFLLSGNMCCGVHKNSLIARISPDETESALTEPYARLFDITGRPMKGWIMVDAKGLTSDAVLKAWVDRSVQFARSLPKK
jgi:hypothetical protein